jgi:hypothetical protein
MVLQPTPGYLWGKDNHSNYHNLPFQNELALCDIAWLTKNSWNPRGAAQAENLSVLCLRYRAYKLWVSNVGLKLARTRPEITALIDACNSEFGQASVRSSANWKEAENEQRLFVLAQQPDTF